MGFDKPDLGFVVHLGAPNSPIAYYQQVGRAGRGVDHAEVLLLPGQEDRAIWKYFASLAFPPEEQVRATLDALADAGRPLSTAALETRVDLRRSRLETMLKVLDVDGAVRRVKGGWVSTGQSWALRRRALRARGGGPRGRAALDDRVRDDRRVPDDVPAPPAGRPGTSKDPAAAATTAPARSSPRPSPARAPRRRAPPWPSRAWRSPRASCGRPACQPSASPLTGKIPAAESAETGRALGRLTDLGWGTRLRDLLADGTPDQPLPEPMVDGIVKVLAAWDWKQRPTAVVAIGSRSRPGLVADTARRIAAIGRLEYLGAVEPAGYRRGRAGAAAATAHSGSSRCTTRSRSPRSWPQAVAAHQGPILLVDDRVDTGWTMTVAARMLRQAGADEVLPFALAMEA